MHARNPHREVADRIRFLLESLRMSRQEFVEAVDGAVGVRSLYSLLDGSRRPSRALAVLIERTWGFRAEYLLEGRGAVWTDAGPLGARVTTEAVPPAEAAVLKFMGASVENARTVVGELDHLRAWSRLFARTLDLVRELDACGSSTAPEDRRTYPFLAKLVYEDSRYMASLYEQLVTLTLRRREYKLINDFLSHFVDDVPRSALGGTEHEQVRSMLAPVREHRRMHLRALEDSIDATYTTIENICGMGLLGERARAHSHLAKDPRAQIAVERLAALDLGPLRAEVSELVAELTEEPDAIVTYWARLQLLLRDLLADTDEEQSTVEARSVEDLEARYQSLLVPLTA